MKVAIVGAGGIGQHLAQQLGERGHDVVLGSRSGTQIAPCVAPRRSEAVRTVRVDAADSAQLLSIAQGADVIVNAVNPPYTKWATQWPPMAASFLRSAEQTGAAVLTMSNLYGYGLVEGPMTEDQPLRPNGVKSGVRATMWREALLAHQAGRVRVAEIRPSDYFGPGAGSAVSYLNRFAIQPAMNGKAALHLRGVMSAPHSWSYITDIASLGVALIEADLDGPDWGRPWHVPSTAPRSLSDVAKDAARVAGVGPKEPRLLVKPLLWAAQAVPLIRELNETAHQFERPFILDSSQAAERFGLAPTPWDDALAATIEWLRADAAN